MKWQIQHTARWPPGKQYWALPKAFFLLRGPELGPPDLGSVRRRPQGESPSRTRVQ